LLLVPSLLSMLRVPLAAVFPFVLGMPAAAFGVLVAAGLTDVLDGWYARSHGQATATGAVADAVTDKVFVATVVIALILFHKMTLIQALFLGTREMGELPLVVHLAFSHEARTKQTDRRANVPGKAATVLQFVAVTAVLFGAPHIEVYLGAAAGAGVLA